MLTTIADEVPDLHLEALSGNNALYWNAWACQYLTEEKKKNISEKTALSGTFNFFPTWEEVSAEVEHRFQKRLPCVNVPDPQTPIVFHGIRFDKDVDFSNFIFPWTVFLHDCDFEHSARMRQATFLENCVFMDTRFMKDADFYFTTFMKRSGFTNCTFFELTNFSAAKFLAEVSFFKTSCSGEVGFTVAQFAAPVECSGTRFAQYYPSLEGALLHDRLTVTVKDSHWPPRPSLVKWLKTEVRRHVLGPYGLPKKESPRQEDTEFMIKSCAALRHNMTKQGLPEEAHFFFRREMSLKQQIVPWFEKPFYWAYRFLSAYGHGVVQSLVALIVLCAVGVWVFKAYGALGWLSAAGLSFAHIFRFMGFHVLYFEKSVLLGLAPWVKVFGAAQARLGLFLLFFLALALRNRFRVQ